MQGVPGDTAPGAPGEDTPQPVPAGEVELGAREEEVVALDGPEPFIYNAQNYEVVTECYEEVCETTGSNTGNTATASSTAAAAEGTETEACPAPSQVRPHIIFSSTGFFLNIWWDLLDQDVK